MIVGRITFGPKPIIQFAEAKGPVPQNAIDPILASFGLLSTNTIDKELPALFDLSELHRRNQESVRKIISR